MARARVKFHQIGPLNMFHRSDPFAYGPICYYQPDSGHLSHPFELPFGGLGAAVVMDTDD